MEVEGLAAADTLEVEGSVAADTLEEEDLVAVGTLGVEGGPMAEECTIEAGSTLAAELVIIAAAESASFAAADWVTTVAHAVSIVATVMASDLVLEDMD